MGDELHPIQTLDGLKRLWKIGVETGRILQAAETCAATPKPPAGGDAGEDRRYELAVALFQAAHGARLVAWSDTTRDYWLKRADAALALPAPVVEREWPDIGEDPMKGTPYEDRMAVSAAALRKAYTVQQPIVPDQTALVWRWHIAALLEAEIRLRSILARDDYAGDPDGDESDDSACAHGDEGMCADCPREAALSEGHSHG